MLPSASFYRRLQKVGMWIQGTPKNADTYIDMDIDIDVDMEQTPKTWTRDLGRCMPVFLLLKPFALKDGHIPTIWLLMYPRGSTSTPQLPFKRLQIPSNRDHEALNGGTLGGLGKVLPRPPQWSSIKGLMVSIRWYLGRPNGLD